MTGPRRWSAAYGLTRALCRCRVTALIGNICTFASAFISDHHWQPCATCACVSVVRFRAQLTRVALGAIRRVQPAMVAARLSLFLCLPRASACAFAFRRYQTHLLQSPRVCLSKSGSTLGRPSASHASTTGQFILAVSKTIKLNQSHLCGHELLHFRIPDQCQGGGSLRFDHFCWCVQWCTR